MGHRIHFKRNAECSSENLTASMSSHFSYEKEQHEKRVKKIAEMYLEDKPKSPWKDDRKPVDHKQIIAYIETGWEIKKVIIIPKSKVKDIESLGYNVHYRYK